jgi:membrane protease YdiL (CAAX protease family)
MGSVCVGARTNFGKVLRAGWWRRDVVELAVGYGLILAVAWTRGVWQRSLYFGAIVWVVGAVGLRFEGWQRMGLRASGFLGSLWVTATALALAMAMVLMARRFDTLNHPDGVVLFLSTFWGYAVWSLVQQLLLQVFVLRRLMRILPHRRWQAIVLAAVLFALVHLPNPLLMALTLVWGMAACWLFLRYGNVYTLGMTHAILGVCMAIAVPGRLDHNMRVGLGYLEYEPHGESYLERGVHGPASDAWEMADDPLRSSANEARP